MADEAMTLAEAHVRGFDLVRHHTERFVKYVADLDGAALDQPVPGLDWTVGQTITHVHSVYERYTIDRRRSDTPEGIAEQNADDIERLGVDVAASAASMLAQVERLNGITDHVAPEARFPFHAGAEVTLAGGWGNLLGELLAHGDDIARATGRPFAIPGDDLEILWRFTLPVAGAWLRPEAADVDASWELRFGFGTVRLAVHHGELRSGDDTPPGAEHHVVEVADAAELTLAFPYRRRPLPGGPDGDALSLLGSLLREF